jgi:hypothetical protein
LLGENQLSPPQRRKTVYHKCIIEAGSAATRRAPAEVEIDAVSCNHCSTRQVTTRNMKILHLALIAGLSGGLLVTAGAQQPDSAAANAAPTTTTSSPAAAPNSTQPAKHKKRHHRHHKHRKDAAAQERQREQQAAPAAATPKPQ